jgi:hypothetical protein
VYVIVMFAAGSELLPAEPSTARIDAKTSSFETAAPSSLKPTTIISNTQQVVVSFPKITEEFWCEPERQTTSVDALLLPIHWPGIGTGHAPSPPAQVAKSDSGQGLPDADGCTATV